MKLTDGFVMDASITLTWCFADEATTTTKMLLESMETNAAHVPSIWTLEIGNILLAAARKNRINYADIMQFLALLKNIKITIDIETAEKGFHDILSLAHNNHLTTYDAAYLELAMRLGKPLATKDRELYKAAKRVGVQTLSM